MLTVTLVTSLFSTEFQWLYPFRVLATGIVILILWKKFGLCPSAPSAIPVLGGMLAFLVWIVLVHPEQERDRQFAQTLSTVPSWISVMWIATRFLGTTIVVPIAEELAFRGYLARLLSGETGIENDSGKIQWFAMIVTSLLFGALHGSWIAASIAGAIYYFVMSYSGRLWDAVISHITTNLLLAIYILASGHWSYW
jgi:CAAX prenyl protease-like protein